MRRQSQLTNQCGCGACNVCRIFRKRDTERAAVKAMRARGPLIPRTRMDVRDTTPTPYMEDMRNLWPYLQKRGL